MIAGDSIYVILMYLLRNKAAQYLIYVSIINYNLLTDVLLTILPVFNW